MFRYGERFKASIPAFLLCRGYSHPSPTSAPQDLSELIPQAVMTKGNLGLGLVPGLMFIVEKLVPKMLAARKSKKKYFILLLAAIESLEEFVLLFKIFASFIV